MHSTKYDGSLKIIIEEYVALNEKLEAAIAQDRKDPNDKSALETYGQLMDKLTPITTQISDQTDYLTFSGDDVRRAFAPAVLKPATPQVAQSTPKDNRGFFARLFDLSSASSDDDAKYTTRKTFGSQQGH